MSLSETDDYILNAKKLGDAFDKEPSIENYIKLRRTCKGYDVSVTRFADFDIALTLAVELNTLNINDVLVGGVLDGNDRDVDELCLRIIEKMLDRKGLEKTGAVHVQSTPGVISDSLISYLLALIAEALSDHDLVPPFSYVILLREYLCGLNPKRFEDARISEKKHMALAIAAQLIDSDEEFSIRKVAKILSVEPSTVFRWFENEGLYEEAKDFRDLVKNIRAARFKK